MPENTRRKPTDQHGGEQHEQSRTNEGEPTRIRRDTHNGGERRGEREPTGEDHKGRVGVIKTCGHDEDASRQPAQS